MFAPRKNVECMSTVRIRHACTHLGPMEPRLGMHHARAPAPRSPPARRRRGAGGGARAGDGRRAGGTRGAPIRVSRSGAAPGHDERRCEWNCGHQLLSAPRGPTCDSVAGGPKNVNRATRANRLAGHVTSATNSVVRAGRTPHPMRTYTKPAAVFPRDTQGVGSMTRTVRSACGIAQIFPGPQAPGAPATH